MIMPFHQKRVPAGTSAGGQFAPTARADDIQSDNARLLDCKTSGNQRYSSVLPVGDPVVDGPWNVWDSPARCKTFLFVGVSKELADCLDRPDRLHGLIRQVGEYDVKGTPHGTKEVVYQQFSHKEFLDLPLPYRNRKRPAEELAHVRAHNRTDYEKSSAQGNFHVCCSSPLHSEDAETTMSYTTNFESAVGGQTAVTVWHNVYTATHLNNDTLAHVPVDYIVTGSDTETNEVGRVLDLVASANDGANSSLGRLWPSGRLWLSLLSRRSLAQSKTISVEHLSNMLEQSDIVGVSSGAIWMQARQIALENKWIKHLTEDAKTRNLFPNDPQKVPTTEAVSTCAPRLGASSANPIQELSFKVEGPFLGHSTSEIKKQIKTYGGIVTNKRSTADLIVKGEGKTEDHDRYWSYAYEHDNGYLSPGWRNVQPLIYESDYLMMLECAKNGR